MGTGSGTWRSGDQHTIPGTLLARLESDPDGEYLDVNGTKLTAAGVWSTANRVANVVREFGVGRHERVATLIENSPEMVEAWWATVVGGQVSVPINTAYKGEYLRHQLRDSGSRVLFVEADLLGRAAEVVGDIDGLEHVVVVGASAGVEVDVAGVEVHRWEDLLTADDTAHDAGIRPSDLGTFVYTGGTTGPSKGCMLSHNYHYELARQIGYCWGRTADDVCWTPLPLFHFNALTTAVLGALVFGGRSAIYRRFSVSNFWPEMNRTGATVTSTLGTMAYLLAHDVDRPEMPRSGSPEANTSLRMIGAAPLPVEIDDILRSRFAVETFSGAYGVTEASLVSWQPPGVRNRPNAAGVLNGEYFDVRIFDDDDNELGRNTDGEIVIRPLRPHVMFEGYWGRPEATVETSRNWWYHTGDIGRIDDDDYLYFVDRKADYLRRRGENISSFEVERILMSHGALADVVVHAVLSQMTEDDLKITATIAEGQSVTEADLFRWCIDQLPYFALPRYIEFRAELPRSPVGRVLKRELRAEGVTPHTWDADTSGITFEKRKPSEARHSGGRRETGESRVTQVMKGIRILEVAEHTFVPMAAAVLADWGADVIKIEHVERGDAMRGLDSTAGMSVGLDGVNLYMEHANRGKRSIAVDLSTPEGLDLVYRLAAKSDVFLTNKLPAVRRKLKVDVDDIRAHNPDIVYVRGTGYGSHGPDVDRGGYDFLAYWARSGNAAAAKVPEIDYMPGQYAPAMGDSIGGLTIAGGISAALLHRERTGDATVVDVSLLATGMWAISAAIALSQQAGEPWSGRIDLGVDTPRNPLVGNFVTADGKWLAFSMLQGFHYWPEMCVALGMPEMVDDPRFTTHELLFANGQAAAELVREALAAQPLAVWKERLRDVKGQWAPVQDSIDIAEDPMVIANGYLLETKTQNGVPVKLVTTPIQYGDTPSPPGRAPGFNEHGDDILRDELGLDDEAIIDLKIKGVVA